MNTNAYLSPPQRCDLNHICEIGEYVFNYTYHPYNIQMCKVNITLPNGASYVNNANMTNHSDGWNNYTFIPTSNTGLWRTKICCNTTSDRSCIDGSFTVGYERECEQNISCELGEYLMDYDYQPYAKPICEIDITYPNGTTYIVDGNMTNNSDGWYNYTINVDVPIGYWRSLICCNRTGEYSCIDHSFYLSNETNATTLVSPSSSLGNHSVVKYQDNTHLHDLRCCNSTGHCWDFINVEYVRGNKKFSFNNMSVSNLNDSFCFETNNRYDVNVKDAVLNTGDELMFMFASVITCLMVIGLGLKWLS